MAIGKEGNVKWVDGLRGFASFLVVVTHIARGFDENLFDPAVSQDGEIRWLQLPIFRVFIQGRIGVAIFSMVTGYVCALKPTKLNRQGNQEGALISMSKSALRRVPRLVLPTTIATILIWAFTQFGVFEVSRRAHNGWLSGMSPKIMPSIPESIAHLLRNMLSTWTRNSNAYDPNQWTLLPLLTGSMKIYVYTMATSFLQPRFRMMTTLLVWSYYYVGNDPYFGMQFFWGAFMADFQNHPPATDFLSYRPRLCRFLAIFCLAAGFVMASLPERNHEWASWSLAMRDSLSHVLPSKPDYGRFSTGLALELISLAIHFSPTTRTILSNRYFLWLGKQSFAVYLIHGPMLRSVLCWMVFGFGIPPESVNAEGQKVGGQWPNPSGTRLLMCLPIWFPMVYGLAVIWTTYVDVWCASFTEKIVSFIREDPSEKPVLPTR